MATKKKTQKNIWSQISDDFNDDGMIHIDAWVTEDGDEEGKVIAKIKESTGEVTYIDKRAKTDKYAQEIIKAILEDLKD